MGPGGRAVEVDPECFLLGNKKKILRVKTTAATDRKDGGKGVETYEYSNFVIETLSTTTVIRMKMVDFLI